ncbi:MAG: riboflavin synthase [Xanthomonadales bacterium]|nr:riboflavin synthase [Xanthomonadales bacterium]
MFTGIVTAIGRIASTAPHDGGLRLAIDAENLPGEALVLGESIAVAGVCLTVAGMAGRRFDCDVSGETLRLTTLGRRNAGDAVNLERALRAGDRLGGHLVSGHVDGIGHLRSIGDDGLSRVFRFEVPQALRRYLAPKGSITVDGTSLTVNAVDTDGFTVNLIPHTLAHTTLGTLAPGDAVNLEVDQVARYVERLLAWRDEASGQ